MKNLSIVMQTSCSGNPTVSFHTYTKLGEQT